MAGIRKIFRVARQVFLKKNWKALTLFVSEWVKGEFVPQIYWGQDGEDVFLADALPGSGFYVDVGAHHPYRFSSTKLLYDRGWSGLNIDVTEAMHTVFPRSRPRDLLHFGLAGEPATRTFYRFSEPALSTLDAGVAEERAQAGWELQCEETMEVEPLKRLLDRYKVPSVVDLLCVDVEGSDLEVLESAGLDEYDFRRILVEVHTPAWALEHNPISVFLEKKGYRPVAVWLRSALFEKQ